MATGYHILQKPSTQPPLFISFLHHFLTQLEMLPLQRLPLSVELFEFEIRLPPVSVTFRRLQTLFFIPDACVLLKMRI